MARGADTSQALGATGRANIYRFLPERLLIVDDPEHHLYDPDRTEPPPDPEFVNDVRLRGVHTPVAVEKCDGGLAVIFGRQRVMALRIVNVERIAAGLEPWTVEVRTKHGDPIDMVALMISENEQRRPTTPMSRARMLQRYLELGKDTVMDPHAEVVPDLIAQAAVLFRVSLETIHNWHKLLGCHAKVQAAYDDGKVPASVARKLSKLEPEEQVKTLAEMLDRGKGRGTEGIRAARKATADPLPDGRKKEPVKGRRYLERALEAARAKGARAQAVREVLEWILGEIGVMECEHPLARTVVEAAEIRTGKGTAEAKDRAAEREGFES